MRDREAERDIPIEYRPCRYLKKIHDACVVSRAHEEEMSYREENDGDCTAPW